MKHERVLAILIAGEFLLGILAIACEFAFEPLLPPALRAYLSAEGSAASGPGETLLTGLWMAVVVSTVLAWIGLLNLLRAARPLYAASWAGYLLLVLLRGPIVGTAAGYVIEMLMALVGGAIMALIYLSELRTRFRRWSEVIGSVMEKAA